MRRTYSIFSGVALACLACSLQAQTSSAPASSGSSKIAVISVQGVIAGTKEGQQASQELNSKFGPKQKEMQARQAEIQQMNDQLKNGGNVMSADKRDELTRQVDQKTRRFQRDVQDAQEQFQAEQQRLLGGISQRLMPVIEKYAKDHGYALVLDVSNPNTPVLYASASNDITKDIIALYDQNPGSAPAGAPGATTATPKAPGSTTRPPSGTGPGTAK